jgi:hypothetical protein
MTIKPVMLSNGNIKIGPHEFIPVETNIVTMLNTNESYVRSSHIGLFGRELKIVGLPANKSVDNFDSSSFVLILPVEKNFENSLDCVSPAIIKSLQIVKNKERFGSLSHLVNSLKLKLAFC